MRIVGCTQAASATIARRSSGFLLVHGQTGSTHIFAPTAMPSTVRATTAVEYHGPLPFHMVGARSTSSSRCPTSTVGRTKRCEPSQGFSTSRLHSLDLEHLLKTRVMSSTGYLSACGIVICMCIEKDSNKHTHRKRETEWESEREERDIERKTCASCL